MTRIYIVFVLFDFFEILGINDLPSQNKYFLLDFRKILSVATTSHTDNTDYTDIKNNNR